MTISIMMIVGEMVAREEEYGYALHPVIRT